MSIRTIIMNGRVAGAISILSIVLMIPAARVSSPKVGFLLVMGLMLLFMITIGLHISSRPSGILINDRNLISLSRFQIVMWTLIILSAFLTAVLLRIYEGNQVTDALALGLDQRLWGLLGISVASLVGTPLLQSTKKVQEPKEEALIKAAKDLNKTEETVKDNAQGVLFKNTSVAEASFFDMFRGDEISNKAYVDVAKLQMFFFTLVAGLTYGIELYEWIEAKKYLAVNATFPEVSAGLMAILAISHAGFQVNNSVTRTPAT